MRYSYASPASRSASPAERDTLSADGVTVELYTARLADLEAGEAYEYRIKADGQCDDWHALQTDDGGAFSALIFPDSQSNDYTDWKHLAQDAAARNEGADFFINMGDLVDNGEDHRQWDAWFDAVAGIIDRIPVAPLMGNHESYNEDWKVREPVAYLHEFALPANGSEEFAGRYYSFDYGPAHFIVLDTQTDEAADFHHGLLEAQQAWFREDVKKTDKKWKIVLMHKDPLQYRIANRPERQEGFSDEGRAWMPLFDEAGIDIVFSAHLHTYRNRGHIKNFERDASGPLYILTGVAGNVRYPGLWVDHALDKTVAPQPETDNYLTLCVKNAGVEIACFLPDGTEIDHETLQK
uniref:metallophosphoesterase n=1 Tax=Mitsuokella multacida TaxID=52226 RepID=UPI003F7DEE2E